MQLFTIFAMLFTAGGVMFAFQNNVPVTVNFFLWRFDSSLAMVMLLALVTGGIIVALVSTPATVKRQWALSRLQKRVTALEKECSALEMDLREARAVRDTIVTSEPATPSGVMGFKRLFFEPKKVPPETVSDDASPDKQS
ncbi:MAG: LapA family protein [Pseudomonadota bacterium]